MRVGEVLPDEVVTSADVLPASTESFP